MSTRVGLSVGSDSLRAVGVRGTQLLWAREAERRERESLDAALTSFLQALPTSGRRRPVVVAAVGPAHVQVRRLAGLPPLTDANLVARLVAENTGRFFLKNGVPLVTGGVRVEEAGTAWVAAFERSVVVAVGAACGAANVRLQQVAPAACVLPLALQASGEQSSSSVTWCDGEAVAEVTYAGGCLGGVRRHTTSGFAAPDAPHPPLAAALAALGDEAWRYAVAYGAALTTAREPLALSPLGGAHDEEAAPRWRVRAAAVAAAMALCAAVLAAPLGARLAEARAARQLAAFGPRWRDAAGVDARLRQATAAVSEVAAFNATRRSTLLLLADVTRALPDSSALVAFRVDSAGGAVVALAPRAATVLTRLEAVRGIVAPEVMGPVTREAAGSRELERVTLRFHLDGRGGRAP